jgi:hypothetical protein
VDNIAAVVRLILMRHHQCLQRLQKVSSALGMLLQGCVKTVSLSTQEHRVDHLLVPVFPTRNGLPSLESIELE